MVLEFVTSSRPLILVFSYLPSEVVVAALRVAVTTPSPSVYPVLFLPGHGHFIGLERLYFSSLSSSMVCTVFLGEPKTEDYRPRRPESYSLLVLLPRAFTGTTASFMKVL